MTVRAWLTIAIAGAALAASSVGCGSLPHFGNVSLHVTIAGDDAVRRVDYEITGPGLGELTGAMMADKPSRSFERLISHVPPGRGYHVHAKAASPDGERTCEGSTTFDVKANGTTRVNLAFGCVNAGDGMVHISIGLACPSFKVSSWTISPLSASIGGTIAVSASTNDTEADAGPVSYEWTASTGSFADPKAMTTTYLCTTAGTALLTVTATSPPCRDMQSVPVTCVADAGAD
jgi:hypothetical protein